MDLIGLTQGGKTLLRMFFFLQTYFITSNIKGIECLEVRVHKEKCEKDEF